MGAPQSISMQTNRFRQQNQDRDASYLEFIQNITKCPLFLKKHSKFMFTSKAEKLNCQPCDERYIGPNN